MECMHQVSCSKRNAGRLFREAMDDRKRYFGRHAAARPPNGQHPVARIGKKFLFIGGGNAMNKNDDVAYYECLYVIELKNGKKEIYARERLYKDDKKAWRRVWIFRQKEGQRVFLPTRGRQDIAHRWFQIYQYDAPTELPSDKKPIVNYLFYFL